MHENSHALARQIVSVTLKSPVVTGNDTGITRITRYRVDDWWDKLTGMSWQDANGNPAAMGYAIRAAVRLPWDDDVIYGTNLDSNMGHIVHITELDTSQEDQP